MFLKPTANPKYAAIKPGQPGFEPERVQHKVFDPARKDFLPPEGRDVGADHDLYWDRRIQAKEVEALNDADAAKSLAAAARAAGDQKKSDAPAPVKTEK